MNYLHLKRITIASVLLFSLAACSGTSDLASGKSQNQPHEKLSVTEFPSPENGEVATNLELISLAFNKAVESNSLKESLITITPPIDYQLDKSQLDSTKTVNLLITSQLKANQQYDFEIIGIKELGSNEAISYKWSYKTGNFIDTTAPGLQKVSPIENASDVDTNLKQLAIYFNEDIKLANLTNLNISPALSGSIQIKGNGIFFSPSENLLANQLYTVSLSGISDASGNTSDPVKLTFTTALGPDIIAPSAPGSLEGSSISSSIVLLQWKASTDNSAIDYYQVKRNGVILFDKLTSTATADTTVQPVTTYKYTITAFDTAGNASQGSSLTLTTPKADATTPGITSVTPSNNQINVLPDISEITVNFNEKIDVNSVNSSTFTLNNGLTGTLDVSTSGMSASFKPDTPLLRGATYSANVNGITDLSGNAAKTYSWSFNTCGDTASATYTLSWDSVADADLTGYKVYYSNKPITKSAASGSIGNVAEWTFNPANLGFKPCSTVYIAVTALGSSKFESSFSNQVIALID